jgi:hypothetical protein
MTTGDFWNPLSGWVAIATGVSTILAVIFITLMFTVNMVFGIANDVFNSIIGISSAVLAWMLFAAHHAKSPLTSQIALALAILGAIFCIVGSVLVIYGFTGFVLPGGIQGSATHRSAYGWRHFVIPCNVVMHFPAICSCWVL